MKTTRKTPRWQVLACSVVLGMFATAPAFAVDALGAFELDGDAVDAPAGGAEDWNTIFSIPAPFPGVPVVSGGATFVEDGPNAPGGKETSAWKGSNKDIDDIPTWERKTAKVVPDKDNILNAYAKAYSVPFPASDLPGHPAVPHDHLIIYFGADRFANNGDAALGFWFFGGDVALNNGGFTGQHTDDDVLVQVDFVRGGVSSEIQIFRWQGDGLGSHGTLNEIAFAAANGSTVCTAGDTACATTNDQPEPAPWAYTPKSGPAGTFPAESFFEGGIDVTALIGEVCFSSFMAESRSSHSETAELKDFALGDFNLCSVAVAKSCPNDPVISQDGTFLTSTFDVTITNDGFGTIYDIELEEDIALPGGALGASECRITSPIGPQVLAQDSPVLLQNAGLLSGNSISATIECDHTAQPLFNAVTTRSSASPGGDRNVTDSYQMVDADTCALQINPMIDVEKECKSVLLVAVNGTVQPQVCNTITVTNNSIEQLINVDVTDAPANGLGQNLLVNGSLAPGEVLVFDDVCYIATATDNAIEEPEQITFSDQALASGDGAISGISDADDDVATCPLCPPPQSPQD
jgi:hypothetical protein